MTREREPLPTKDQIFAISDLFTLRDLEERVETQQKRIMVDLDFGNRDEEWASRARGALAAHDICLGNVRKRIRHLTGNKSSTVEQEIARKEAKAALKAAQTQSRATHFAIEKEHKKIAAINKATAFMESVAWQKFFVQQARKILNDETYSKIENAANERHQRKMKNVIDLAEREDA